MLYFYPLIQLCYAAVLLNLIYPLRSKTRIVLSVYCKIRFVQRVVHYICQTIIQRPSYQSTFMYDINSIPDAITLQTMTVQLEYIDLSLLFFINVGLLQYHLLWYHLLQYCYVSFIQKSIVMDGSCDNNDAACVQS